LLKDATVCCIAFDVKLGKNVRRKAISVADGHATEKDPEPDSV
jgi:hypothetical protein